MPLLNTAKQVKLGAAQVQRVFKNGVRVWQWEIPVVTTLIASKTQVNAGEATTLTATVNQAGADGTVNFRTDSPTGTIIATDVAKPWTTTVFPQADTTYHAEYTGSLPYLPNTSTGVFVNVAGAANLVLSADKTAITQGESAVLTATIPGVNYGTVVFHSGSPTGPVVATDTSSPWTCTVSPTQDTTYYAEYVANAEYQATTSNALAIDYYIPTTTQLSASRTTVNQGESTTFTALVPGVSAGTVRLRTGSPTGTIIATDTDAPWTFTVTPTKNDTYYAEYVGSGDYSASVSTGVTVIFSIPTSISLAIDKTSVAAGSPIVLTATVTGATTGTVRFRTGSTSGTVVATDTASPWTATLTPSADTTYYAEYVAAGDYLGSFSNPVSVDRYVTTSMTLAGGTTINNGQATTLTATLTGVPSGTVHFRTGSTSGTIIASVAGPPYQVSVAPGGSTAYYATYPGSGDYLACNSNGVTVAVRQLVTKTWSGYATATQCYNGSGNQKSGDLYYGYYSSTQGNQRSMFVFDMPDLRGTVAVTGVRIKFYNQHHFWNSGGSIPTGLHVNAGIPGTWTGAYENLQTLGNAPKPGWVDAWMGDNFKNYVKAYLIKGFILGPGPSNSTDYYGYATNNAPYMEVQYQVWE